MFCIKNVSIISTPIMDSVTFSITDIYEFLLGSKIEVDVLD
ncbi:hypothetical protein [Paenimyroides tangerinum]|nr:hypothetical protein [Paenimyroides tangerinum]